MSAPATNTVSTIFGGEMSLGGSGGRGSATGSSSAIEAVRESMDAGLPFKLDLSVAREVNVISRESVMGAKEASQNTDIMMKKWKISNEKEQNRVLFAMLGYFSANGTSPRGNYKVSLECGGKEYPSNVISSVLGDSIRQYARYYADLQRYYMSEHRDFAIECAKRVGLPTSMSDLAFDTADFCSNLTDQEIEITKDIKNNVLVTSQAYHRVKAGRARKVTSVGQQPSTQGYNQTPRFEEEY